jgi:hypothetical protein
MQACTTCQRVDRAVPQATVNRNYGVDLQRDVVLLMGLGSCDKSDAEAYM